MKCKILEFLALPHELVKLPDDLRQTSRLLAALNQIGVITGKKLTVGTHQLRELLALMEPLAERIDKVTLFRFDRTFGNDAERFFQRNERIEKRSSGA